MEESSMMINFFWFVGGAMLYKFISHLLAIKTSMEMLTQALIACLAMAKKVDEQSLLALERECDALKNNGASEEEIEKSKDLHLRAQGLWRAMIIGVLNMYCPKQYRKIFNLEDWKSAMKLLKQ